ncbi:MAG TPA: hypothetical protein VF522_19200 [Ramlibacter sp.]|uniref:hypothetical protein n=1 Tax=Ramlibacter sp. TaxID=1917967 RepID=UPI002ED2CB3F
MRLHPPPPNETPVERQLRQDLFMARWDIISLAPDQFGDLLRSYFSCKTRAASRGWEADVVEKIIEWTEPLGEDTRPDLFGARANCPLCRQGAQSYYEQGFAFPEGLRRHLIGYGRTHQCIVMRAVMGLARVHWNGEFSSGEEEARNQEHVALEARRKVETVYILGPKDSPLLVDENLFWKGARPAEGDFSLKWAEQRLFSLGFQINVDDRKRSYTKQLKNGAGEFVIYADPRQKDDIRFSVFDAAVVRGKKAGLVLSSFKIRDSWKNDLPEKVAAGADAAARSSRR